jgi:hypothetical protein
MHAAPFLVWLALAPAAAVAPAAKTQVEHQVQRGADAPVPVTVQQLQQKLDEARHAVPPGQRLPRIILDDTAGAANQREHERISGGLVVMVMAVTADPKELPLTGLFLTQPDGKRLPLIPVAVLPPALTTQLHPAAPLGPNVFAALFYAPLAKHLHGVLEADFSGGRSGFRLANELPLTPEMMQFNDAQLQETPSAAALGAMIAREYPGFAVDRATLLTLEQAH